MVFNEVNVFYKFCVNRVSYSEFMKMMQDIYPGPSSYAENLWPSFRDNPIGFIVSRSERTLFDTIQDDIKKRGYKG